MQTRDAEVDLKGLENVLRISAVEGRMGEKLTDAAHYLDLSIIKLSPNLSKRNAIGPRLGRENPAGIDLLPNFLISLWHNPRFRCANWRTQKELLRQWCYDSYRRTACTSPAVTSSR